MFARLCRRHQRLETNAAPPKRSRVAISFDPDQSEPITQATLLVA
jgi:hypothetical protein